jgi:hypothetical protein
MKTKFFFSMVAVAALTLFVGCKDDKNVPNVIPTEECTYEIDPVCFCEKNPNDARCVDEPQPQSNFPDSIKNGSDFYVIFMDEASETSLGDKVKVHNMLRTYDVWDDGNSLVFIEPSGINAWGEAAPWVSVQAAGTAGWNGGAIIAILEQFEVVPDLTPLMSGNYYLHFAVKSPTNQTSAGTSLFMYSEGPDQKYYVGPQESKPADNQYLANYAHDGEWHHFEIPVSQLINDGYLWTQPLYINEARADGNHYRYLFGFQGNPHVVGNEINLDAIFFYKKPAQ